MTVRNASATNYNYPASLTTTTLCHACLSGPSCQSSPSKAGGNLTAILKIKDSDMNVGSRARSKEFGCVLGDLGSTLPPHNADTVDEKYCSLSIVQMWQCYV